MPDGPVRIALAAALDDWARLRRATTTVTADKKDIKNKEDWQRLVAAAQATDVDPWRNRLRDAWIKSDKKAAQELVAAVPRESLDPAQVLLAQPLCTRDEFIALVRDAQFRHPADFWLNHTLALALMEKERFDAGEAWGFYRVALALRPESPGVLLNLANALSQLDRYDEAIAAYEQAIHIKPDYATAYSSLGAFLCDRRQDYAGAIAAFRRAIELGLTDDLMALSAAAHRPFQGRPCHFFSYCGRGSRQSSRWKYSAYVP